MKEPIFDIKRDFKKLAVVLAVIIIPLMYSYFYLNAFWDPYSKLNQLPVAVVNEDKGASINLEQRNLGQELVDELKENNKLKWIFTEKADAAAGLENRKYYALVSIPENFSSNIASVDSADKKQGVIIYQPQQKRNYLAAQILSKAILELEAKITEKVAKQAVNAIVDDTKKLPEKLAELGDGLNRMHADGTNKLNENLGVLVYNQKKFNDGVNQLNGSLSKAGNGVNTISDGSNTLAAEQGEFYQALLKSVPQFKQLSDGSAFFQKNLMSLEVGLIKINTGASLMNSKIPELKTDLLRYGEGLKNFSQSIAPLATGLQPLKTGSSQVSAGLDDYSTKMDAFDTGVSLYVESVKTLSDTDKSVAAMLTSYINDHPEAVKDKNIQNIMAIFQKSQGSLDQWNTASESIRENAAALSAASQKLAAGSKQLNEGVEELADGAAPLAEGATQLADGALPLAAGLDMVSNGTAQMLEAISQASGSATKLKDGYSVINDGVQNAAASIGTAASNAGLLEEASNRLSSGVSELKNGIMKIADGGKKLENNSAGLLAGENKLRDGAAELDDKVAEAYTKASDNTKEMKERLPKLEGLADFIADPVRIDEQDIDAVSDYGTAFGPYFISLSLWVGALIMFIVIYLNPQMKFKRKLVKSAHMDIKFLMYPLIGIVQGVALALILLNVLNLKVTDKFMFFGVIILVSLCFISIVQFLIVNLGDVGKFLAMLLLILQLTASGGTFPNELVPKFFNVINPFMPMTYSIYALKETISGGNNNFMIKNIIVLAVIMVVFLLASLLLTGNKSATAIDEIENADVVKSVLIAAEINE